MEGITNAWKGTDQRPDVGLADGAASGLHVDLGEFCPYCDQPIPNDRAQEIQRLFNEQVELKARAESAAEIAKAKTEAAAQQTAARNEGIKIGEAAGPERIQSLVATNESLQAATTEKLAEVERQKNEALADKEALEANMDQRAQEIREAMEKEKTDALNAKETQHFEERLKLKAKVDDLQRRLDQKTPGELGDDAEVDLFEDLKAAFPDDHITRVPKGTPGADIHHVVKHNSKECGKIIYDSKNRKDWKDVYATKLRDDQIAAKGEHAILSTSKFPAGVHQLAEREGVIIANPARVLMLAEIFRRQIIQNFSLRIAGKERDAKKTELYTYITSELFHQELDSLDDCASKLEGIDADEEQAQGAVRKKRGLVIKSLKKIKGGICAEIERIIGTAEDLD